MSLNGKLLEFIRFCVVGTTALIVQYALFYVLFKVSGHHNLAYFVSYLMSAILNFILTVRYTFKVNFSKSKLLGFVGCHLFNLILQLLLFNLFIWMGLSEVLAPWPVYAIAVPSNFVLVRLVMLGLGGKQQKSN